jgi:FdhE protein
LLDRISDEKLLSGLKAAREAYPALAQVIDFHTEVIAARSALLVRPPEFEPHAGEVAKLVDQRTPMLERWDLEWDLEAFTALAARICEIGARHREELAGSFENVGALLIGDPQEITELVRGHMLEGSEGPPELDETTREVLSFVLTHALFPFLAAYASVLSPLIVDKQWYQRRCPICGSEPDLGYLEKKVGGLRLLCSHCDTVWTYKRGECAYCGESGRGSFSYYLSEDDSQRLYVCESCERYLKVLDGRNIAASPMLPLQRILTVAMDISARQEGYR